MKKTIWKYQLVAESVKIEMPIGAEILTVQIQDGIACLWALVDPNADKEERIIEVFGTGHPVPYDMGVSRKYIATFQLNGGTLVYHAFEYTGV